MGGGEGGGVARGGLGELNQAVFHLQVRVMMQPFSNIGYQASLAPMTWCVTR